VVRPRGLLFDPQLPLNLLQRHTFGFRNHRFHPDQLQHHHPRKEREHITRRERRDHPREESSEQGREDPVRETAERLALRAMAVGKYFGDENPDDRALPDGVRGDEGEDADGNEREMVREESPRDQAE